MSTEDSIRQMCDEIFGPDLVAEIEAEFAVPVNEVAAADVLGDASVAHAHAHDGG